MLEIVCALALFTSICAILVHGYIQLITVQTKIWEHHRAWSLARMVVEKVRIGEFPLGITIQQPYTITVAMRPYQVRTVNNFNIVTVHISWTQKNTTKLYTVTLQAGMLADVL